MLQKKLWIATLALVWGLTGCLHDHDHDHDDDHKDPIIDAIEHGCKHLDDAIVEIKADSTKPGPDAGAYAHKHFKVTLAKVSDALYRGAFKIHVEESSDLVLMVSEEVSVEFFKVDGESFTAIAAEKEVAKQKILDEAKCAGLQKAWVFEVEDHKDYVIQLSSASVSSLSLLLEAAAHGNGHGHAH